MSRPRQAARLAARIFGIVMASGLVAIAVAGLAVRLTVRDRDHDTAAFFYATPPLVIALLVGLAAGVTAVCGWRKIGACGGVIALVLAAWAASVSLKLNRTAPATTATVRMLFWNVDDAPRGWEKTAEAIRERNYDVVAMVEAGARRPLGKQALQDSFPEYQVTQPDLGLAAMSTGELKDMGRLRVGLGGRSRRYRVGVRGNSFDLVIVDIRSDPTFSRSAPMAAVARGLTGLEDDAPLVVAGDFNLPADSVHLDHLRGRFRNAFETAGNGWFWTWPAWVPLQAIDHVWLDPRIRVARCRLETTALSSHRMVEVDFDLPPVGEVSR